MEMNNKNTPRWSSVKTFAMAIALSLPMALSTGCSDDDEPSQPEKQSIVAVAQANSNLTSLVAALTKYPDLVSTLSGEGQFTVFAPTNAAFANLLTAIGQSTIDDVPEDVLKSVLQYHVITSGKVLSTQLTTGDVETANGEDIAVSVASGVKLNGSVNVTTADIDASNGVVHVVDAVLVPPSMRPIIGTIVAPAFFNKNFTTLISAVKAADESILTTLLG
jgi:transforming growth factor-beta-induced protein